MAVFLAGLRRRSYLGAGLVATGLLPGLAACGPHPPRVEPVAFTPASREAFEQAAAPTLPRDRMVVRITWRSDDGHVQYSGAGAARVSPPDSLRADIAAALGLGRATVILTGDQVASAPATVVDQVLPRPFALWAALGIVKVPAGTVQVDQAGDAARTLWRTTDAQGRQTVFELVGGALNSVSRQEGGQQVALLTLTHGADGAVSQANLTDYQRGLRLQVSITSRQPSSGFPPETWRLGP